jgi:hypothetical protein
LDTEGPEIRTGFFANDAKKIVLTKGATVILTNDCAHKGDATKLACSYHQIATSVTGGQQILVADGSLFLTVLTTDPAAGNISCRVENNCSIGERKNMNLPGVKVDLPTFTDKDVEDIVEFGIKRGVEFIAASFVLKASDVTNLRNLLKSHEGGDQIQIICKIENQEGLENYDEILAETDGIMVARGDVSCVVLPPVPRGQCCHCHHCCYFIRCHCRLTPVHSYFPFCSSAVGCGDSRCALELDWFKKAECLCSFVSHAMLFSSSDSLQGVLGTENDDSSCQCCWKASDYGHPNVRVHDHQSTSCTCRVQ